MAATWARAEVILDADGRRLPAQVYKYAKQAGDQGGEVLEKEFDKHLTDMGSYQLNRMRERMKKEGTKSGRILGRTVSQAFEAQIKARIGKAVDEIGQAFTFEDGLENWAKGFDKVGEASERMRSNLQLARDEGRLSTAQWKVLNDQLADAAPMMDEIAKKQRALKERTVESNDALSKHTSLWKRLSANTRQWTMIIGAVISGMGELSTLASAAGGGLLVLGGAFAALVAGIGTTIAAFKVFAGDIDDLPPQLRKARGEFDKFTASFGELGDAIAVAAFKDSADAWKSLTRTVKTLTPAFERMGTVIGDLLDDFAVGVKRNEKGLEQFVDNSSRIFGALMRTVGRLGEALLNAFNNPAFQGALDKLVGWVDDLVTKFSNFVNSEGFTEWIDNSVFILGKLNGLLEAAAGALADLVDDRAIELTGQFLDNLTELVEGPLSQMLEVAKELDIFGLIAEALNKFFTALEPLGAPMEELAIAVNDVIQAGIDTLAPIIEDIAEALAPFVKALADFMKENPKEVANGLIAIAGAFAIFKAAKVGQVAIDMLAFSTSIGVGGEKIKKFDAKKLGRIGLGIAGLATVFATQLIPDDFWDQFDIESNVPNRVLTGAGIGAMFGAWGALIGAGIGVIVSLFEDFEGTFNDIGTNLIATITGGPMGGLNSALATWFADLVPEEWRTSDNPFQQAMAAMAAVLEDPGSFIVNMPTIFQGAWDQVTAGMTTFQTGWDTFWGTTLPTAWTDFWATLNNPEFWFAVSDAIGAWAAGLIDSFTSWLANLFLSWGSFWNSLPTLALSIGLTIINGVKTWLNQLWTGFVAWFGSVMSGWNNFWNGLFNSPKTTMANIGSGLSTGLNQIWTGFVAWYGSITAGWNAFWGGLAATVSRVIGTIVGSIQRIFAPIQDALGRLGSLFGAGGGGGKGAASGTVVYGPRRLLVGEAGPEAIVPLNRSLSKVDPSVRWLSAIAQGKTSMASGGVTGGSGKVVNIAPGAVQINGAVDPQRTAMTVVNRLAERVAG